jgi:hypothetical protein
MNFTELNLAVISDVYMMWKIYIVIVWVIQHHDISKVHTSILDKPAHFIVSKSNYETVSHPVHHTYSTTAPHSQHYCLKLLYSVQESCIFFDLYPD